MTVSVNAVGQRQDETMDTLTNAVGLAMKFYDLKLTSEQKKAAEALTAQKEAKKAEEDQRKMASDFNSSHEPRMERPTEGPFVPIEQAPSFARETAPKGSIGFVPTSFGQKQRELNIAEQTLNENRSVANKARIADIQKEFDQKPRIKQSQEQITTADEVDQLLSVNNPIADNIGRMKVARIANGVGVLTDKDVDRVGGSQDVVSNAKRIARKISDGSQLLPEDKEQLKEINRVFRASAQNSIKSEAERFAQQKASYVNMTRKQVYDTLGVDGIIQPVGINQGQGGNQGGGLTAQQIAAQELLKERASKKSVGSSGSFGGR